LANDSNYGLSASVWSRNRRRALALARRLQAGAVTINDHLMSHGLAETPWGGFKESGLGRTHGAEGFAEMTQPQVLVDDLLSALPRAPWWHPHDGTVYRGLLALLFLLVGGPWERVKALPAVLRLFSRSLKR
jgi:succinate-semialdehyde dehydrogenase/glutarate-semialdehyde dehydrogenase